MWKSIVLFRCCVQSDSALVSLSVVEFSSPFCVGVSLGWHLSLRRPRAKRLLCLAVGRSFSCFFLFIFAVDADHNRTCRGSDLIGTVPGWKPRRLTRHRACFESRLVMISSRCSIAASYKQRHKEGVRPPTTNQALK